MSVRHPVRAGVALVAAAIAVAGCGSAAVQRHAVAHAVPSASPDVTALPAGWQGLRLPSGAVLPYPTSWRTLSGDPGTGSAALLNTDGSVRAYLNATPADRQETLADWVHFRVRHNAQEGDRDVRLINSRTRIRLANQPASCVTDEYATSRSRYVELACIVAPTHRSQATVLVAAAQPNAWARERAALEFAINHFTA